MDLLLEKGLSFERLNSLANVLTSGGLAKAAPRDVNRQNIIGRQLRDLESFFGVTLTEKKGKLLALNNEGKELGAIALQILSVLEDFKRAAQGQRKIFRISAGGSLYAELVAPRLMKLRSLKLETHLKELTHAVIFEALREGQVDGAVVWGDAPKSYRLEQIALGNFKYAFFGAKSLLKGSVSEKKLFTYPFAVVEQRDLSAEIINRVQSEEVVRVDENIPALRLVQSKQFVSILPRLFEQHLPKSEFRVIELNFLNAYERRVRYLWNRKSCELRGFSRAWVEKIAEHFRIS